MRPSLSGGAHWGAIPLRLTKSNMKYTIQTRDGDKTFTLIPQSIRYSRFDEFHAYGRRTSFQMTFVTPDGARMRKFFSDIGTSQSAAFHNALRTLAIYV